MTRNQNRRSAMVLICVVVALGIATTLTGLMIQSSLRTRRQMRNEWQLEQTRMLLDVGIRTSNSLSFTDEQEFVLDEAIAGYARCRVSIEPIREPTSPKQRVYEVTAMIESRDDPPVITRRSRQHIVTEAIPTTVRPAAEPPTANQPEGQ